MRHPVLTELRRAERNERDIERAFTRLVRTLDNITEQLEALGETQMDLLHQGLASRFHNATGDLRKLTNELKKPKLIVGDRVRFTRSWDIYQECIIPEGAQATIVGTGDTLLVEPDDVALQAALAEWDGHVLFTEEDEGNIPLERIAS